MAPTAKSCCKELACEVLVKTSVWFTASIKSMVVTYLCSRNGFDAFHLFMPKSSEQQGPKLDPVL